VLRTARAKLKKQSQFAGGQIDVNSYMKGEYEEIAAFWARKNKANSKPNAGLQRVFGISSHPWPGAQRP